MYQSMSGRAAQERIDSHIQGFAVQIRDEQLTLEQSHTLLLSGTLDLFQTAALAKVIACFQCSVEE